MKTFITFTVVISIQQHHRFQGNANPITYDVSESEFSKIETQGIKYINYDVSES